MNNFEKAVIGVARADQAARRVENTMNLVAFAGFGILVIGIGIFIYTAKRKDEKGKKLAIELANTYGVADNPDLYSVLRLQSIQVLESLKANPQNTGVITLPPAIKTKYAGQTIFNNLTV